jgi:hypothetical protein
VYAVHVICIYIDLYTKHYQALDSVNIITVTWASPTRWQTCCGPGHGAGRWHTPTLTPIIIVSCRPFLALSKLRRKSLASWLQVPLGVPLWIESPWHRTIRLMLSQDWSPGSTYMTHLTFEVSLGTLLEKLTIIRASPADSACCYVRACFAPSFVPNVLRFRPYKTVSCITRVWFFVVSPEILPLHLNLVWPINIPPCHNSPLPIRLENWHRC